MIKVVVEKMQCNEMTVLIGKVRIRKRIGQVIKRASVARGTGEDS